MLQTSFLTLSFHPRNVCVADILGPEGDQRIGADTPREVRDIAEIPPELYDLVSEVLWFAHRLDETWKTKNGGVQ